MLRRHWENPMSGENAEIRNLLIRTVRDEDIPEMTALYNHFVRTTTVSFEESEVTAEQMNQRISSPGNYTCLVAEQNGRVIGFTYASRWKERAAYSRTAETTVYLAPDQLGRGIGTALYKGLLDQLARREFHVLIAVIALPNPASAALHEKLGFRRAACFHEVGRKFNRWIDVEYWEKIL